MHPINSRIDSLFTIFPRPLRDWQLDVKTGDPSTEVRLLHPDSDKVRMRRLVSRSARRPVFKQFALKPGRVVQCESQAELDFSLFMDATPAVTAYGEQPFCICYYDCGQPRKHIPDFAAEIDGLRHIFEIKKQDWQEPDVLARTALLSDVLSRSGITYHLVGPGHVPPIRVHNATLLLQRARRANTALGSQLLQERVRRSQCITLADLGWDKEPVAGQSAAREIVEGRLTVDQDQPLTGGALVRTRAAIRGDS